MNQLHHTLTPHTRPQARPAIAATHTFSPHLHMAANASTSAAEYAQRRFGLRGRTALVTGATRGIGKAVVEELSRLGAQVGTLKRMHMHTWAMALRVAPASSSPPNLQHPRSSSSSARLPPGCDVRAMGQATSPTPSCRSHLDVPTGPQVYMCARSAEDLQERLSEWAAQGLAVQVRWAARLIACMHGRAHGGLRACAAATHHAVQHVTCVDGGGGPRSAEKPPTCFHV